MAPFSRTPFPTSRLLTWRHARSAAEYALELLVIGGICFGLAKLDLALAATHPGSIPIAAAPGFALAAVLLRGLRMWPAIFAAFLAARAPAAIRAASRTDSALPLLIAAGTAFAAVVAGYLIKVWSEGRRSFETPAGIARFAAVSLGASAMLGATIGAASPWLMGDAGGAELASLWIACWLRDASGMLVVGPALVLWAPDRFRAWKYRHGWLGRPWLFAAAFLATSAVGFVAFSPLLELPVNRGVCSDMCGAAHTNCADGNLLLVRLQPGGQFAQVPGRDSLLSEEEHRIAGEQRDRLQIMEQIEGKRI